MIQRDSPGLSEFQNLRVAARQERPRLRFLSCWRKQPCIVENNSFSQLDLVQMQCVVLDIVLKRSQRKCITAIWAEAVKYQVLQNKIKQNILGASTEGTEGISNFHHRQHQIEHHQR